MNPKINFNKVLAPITGGNVVMATQFLSPQLVVRATRKRYDGRLLKNSMEIYLTIGRPNYAEREFIKKCKAAGEPFPVKKVQLKIYHPPKR